VHEIQNKALSLRRYYKINGIKSKKDFFEQIADIIPFVGYQYSAGTVFAWRCGDFGVQSEPFAGYLTRPDNRFDKSGRLNYQQKRNAGFGDNRT
jgi:hypothetical protein